MKMEAGKVYQYLDESGQPRLGVYRGDGEDGAPEFYPATPEEVAAFRPAPKSEPTEAPWYYPALGAMGGRLAAGGLGALAGSLAGPGGAVAGFGLGMAGPGGVVGENLGAFGGYVAGGESLEDAAAHTATDFGAGLALGAAGRIPVVRRGIDAVMDGGGRLLRGAVGSSRRAPDPAVVPPKSAAPTPEPVAATTRTRATLEPEAGPDSRYGIAGTTIRALGLKEAPVDEWDTLASAAAKDAPIDVQRILGKALRGRPLSFREQDWAMGEARRKVAADKSVWLTPGQSGVPSKVVSESLMMSKPGGDDAVRAAQGRTFEQYQALVGKSFPAAEDSPFTAGVEFADRLTGWRDLLAQRDSSVFRDLLDRSEVNEGTLFRAAEQVRRLVDDIDPYRRIDVYRAGRGATPQPVSVDDVLGEAGKAVKEPAFPVSAPLSFKVTSYLRDKVERGLPLDPVELDTLRLAIGDELSTASGSEAGRLKQIYGSLIGAQEAFLDPEYAVEWGKARARYTALMDASGKVGRIADKSKAENALRAIAGSQEATEAALELAVEAGDEQFAGWLASNLGRQLLEETTTQGEKVATINRAVKELGRMSEAARAALYETGVAERVLELAALRQVLGAPAREAAASGKFRYEVRAGAREALTVLTETVLTGSFKEEALNRAIVDANRAILAESDPAVRRLAQNAVEYITNEAMRRLQFQGGGAAARSAWEYGAGIGETTETPAPGIEGILNPPQPRPAARGIEGVIERYGR